MSYLQRFKANNWTNNNVQRSYQRLQSTMPDCTQHCEQHYVTALVMSVYAKLPCPFDEVCYHRYAWRLWLCFSNSMNKLHYPRETHSSVGVLSSKLCPFSGNWAKSRGWVLFQVLLCSYTVIVVKLAMSKTKVRRSPNGRK